MNPPQRTSNSRIISIASIRPARAPQWLSVLALICDHRVIDLAELAQSIRADRKLCNSVTGAASQEFGWPWPSVEDAIVLLGGKRLCKLLSASISRGFSATQSRRTFHRNSNTPAAKLCLLETFQGEPK